MTTFLMLLGAILGLGSFLSYIHNKNQKLITIIKPNIKPKKVNLVKFTLSKEVHETDPGIQKMTYAIAGMFTGLGIFILSAILALMGIR